MTTFDPPRSARRSPTDVGPLGDRAFLAQFADADLAARWAEGVRRANLPGVVEATSSYESAAVYVDPELVGDWDGLLDRLRNLEPATLDESPGRLVRVPTVYDGPDLADVARSLGLSAGEVVEAHSSVEYRVFAVGFLPGFPYAGYLPGSIAGLPRRPSPKRSVAAGSVAIVGEQTGIYPQDSPGGWHLIGRTAMKVVDLAAGYFPIRAGDRLKFDPIG